MTYYNVIKDCNLVYKCFMILRPEVSPCKVRVFRALHVALREIVKKKILKNPDGNGNCWLSLATVHFWRFLLGNIHAQVHIDEVQLEVMKGKLFLL